MIVQAISPTRLPMMRSLLDDVIGLIDEIRLVFNTDTSAASGESAT